MSTNRKSYSSKSQIRSKSHSRYSQGLTYVELIVVLSIFSIFAGTAIFNYKNFQAKVDIRNLSNDIALTVVEAQKSALSGRLPLSVPDLDPPWRPSYGILFDVDTPTSFLYFVDLNPNKYFDSSSNPCNFECLKQINITKGNYISDIKRYNTGNTTNGTSVSGDLSITFTRPNSGATFNLNGIEQEGIEFFEIEISSPEGTTAFIRIYPSGRVEVI